MGFYKPLADGKAQPCSWRSRRRFAVKLIEDALEIILSNPLPAIGNANLQLVRRDLSLYLDRCEAFRVLEGVVQQVHYHLHNKRKIQRHERQLRGEVDSNLPLPCGLPELVYSRADNILYIALLGVKMQGAAFESGHVKQVLHELIHSPRFALCCLQ